MTFSPSINSPTSSQPSAASILNNAKRIVIKFGSALVCQVDGSPDAARLKQFAQQIAALRAGPTHQREIILVSSGAVALGRSVLGLTAPLRLDQKQAAAAVGQSHLIQAWQNAFAVHDLTVAQILLTLGDTENRRRYLNASATLETLLPLDVIPLVNENDTIATAEIRYGDNDRLAAHTAQMLRADLLILLSDIDGLYEADPRNNPSANHIPYIAAIDDNILAKAGGANTSEGVGTGGMITKIEAAKIATNAGIPVLIADGRSANPLTSLADGSGRASVFAPAIKTTTARRQWIAGRQAPMGTLTVDQGAAEAIKSGSSLLAAGILSASSLLPEKTFQRGDLLEIADISGAKLAMGLTAFDQSEINLIKGLRSEAIAATLGEARQATVIHRNDLVLNSG